MKKYLYILFLLYCFSFKVSAQISYTCGWEPSGLNSWTYVGTGIFSRITTTFCSGTACARANVYYGGTNTFSSPLLGTSNGQQITFSFNYKVTEFSGGTAAAAVKVDILAQWSNSTSGPWTTFKTINSSNHNPSTDCANISVDFTPDSGNLYVQFLSTAVGGSTDIYYHFDDISISQASGSSAPTITTTTITSILETTADGGGNVTSDGGDAITARGICWNTSADPTTSNSKTSEAGTTGVFSSSITGLSAQTQYYVRAYATNGIETSYGSNENFYTLSTKPTAHSAIFSGVASSGAQIDLTFSAASTYGADGYIILRTTGATAPTNSGVVDATIPVDLSFPGGTTLVTTITNNTTTTYNNTDLAGNTQYSYAIIPFNWDLTNSTTYNYKTDGTIPTATATTPDVPANLGFFASGNIVNNGTLIQTDDENYFTLNNGTSASISGTGTFTNVKLHCNSAITFSSTMSGSISKTYISASKSLRNSSTYINGTLTNLGTLTLDASSTFKNSGAFTNNGTLTANATSTVEFNGSIAQTITSGGSEFGNIIINNTVAPAETDGVLLADALSLNSASTLTLTDGIVICNGKILTVKNPAANSLTATSTSWIYGTSTSSCLRKYIADNSDTYTFPVGIATRANKAELINNSLTDGGAFFIDAWFNASPTNPNTSFPTTLAEASTHYTSVHTDGVWVLDHTGTIDGTYNLKLYFNGAFAGLEDNKFSILSRPTASVSGADWTMVGTNSNTTAASGYVYRIDLNSFSEKGVAITPAPLPLELLNFTATYNNKKVDLSWQTITEINNDFFTIEKSLNGIDFEKVLIKNGSGNSNQLLSYFDIDENPFGGISYYRLKQTDFDGKYSYSDIKSVYVPKNNENTELDITIYPNPTKDNIKVIIVSEIEAIAYYTISDMLGKEIYQTNTMLEKGINSIDINISNYTTGVYQVSVKTDKSLSVEKIIKQ